MMRRTKRKRVRNKSQSKWSGRDVVMHKRHFNQTKTTSNNKIEEKKSFECKRIEKKHDNWLKLMW